MHPPPSRRSDHWVGRRLWVQLAFLFAWLDPLLLRMHGFCAPVFHCYSCPLATFACPIGAMANFSALHLWPLLALGVIFAVGGLVGTLVCGWACPFGLLQDLLGRIGLPKWELPGWSGYLRYVVLGSLVLLIPFLFGEASPLFFCRLCPAGALEAALPNAAASAVAGGPIAWPSPTKLVILAVFVAASLFSWRPWCTALCPLGGLLALFNPWSLVHLRFHTEKCGECGLCRRLCRYGGATASLAADQQCIRCLECTRCKAVTVETILSPSAGTKPVPADVPAAES